MTIEKTRLQFSEIELVQSNILFDFQQIYIIFSSASGTEILAFLFSK
jgi:hypothetical protein